MIALICIVYGLVWYAVGFGHALHHSAKIRKNEVAS